MRTAVLWLSLQLKMQRPPVRAGISFTVGAQLEARHKHNKWCSAVIQQVDCQSGRVLVRFRSWAKPGQDWFHWDSALIRPVDRVSLRRTGLNYTTEPMFAEGCKVMACWTDCKFYPARVLRVHTDESYTVRFYDGVVRTVRPTGIKPYDQTWIEENSSEEWEESESEQDKETREGLKELEKETGHMLGDDRGTNQSEEGDKETTKELTEEGLTEEELTEEGLTEEGLTEERLPEEGLTEERLTEERLTEEGLTEERLTEERQKGNKAGYKPCSLKEDIKKEQHEDLGTKDTPEDTPEEGQGGDKEGGHKEGRHKEVGHKEGGHKGVGHKEGGHKELGHKEGGERRKRRTERRKEAPPKRKRMSDRKHQPITEDPSCPGPAHMDRDVLQQRQAHLPTSHKYSREPLYRVIKRQPPPILSIDLDHNQFKCPAPDCNKSFRKSSLLHCHLKYYHSTAAQSTTATTTTQSTENTSTTTVDRRKGESNPDLSTCCRGDQETVATETIGPDRIAVETGPGPRRDRKHFLRVKLKKKKKKKKRRRSHTGFFSSDDENMTHPPVSIKHEEGSDWSTLTAESGEDTPFWPVAAETHDVVRCVCGVTAVSNYMLQCTSCSTWQHGSCIGLNQIPPDYTCFNCLSHLSASDTRLSHLSHLSASDTRLSHLSHLSAPVSSAPDGLSKHPHALPHRPAPDWSRGSVLRRRLCSDWSRGRRALVSDWLWSGHMFGLSCVNRNYSEEHSEQIQLTHSLLGQVQTVGALSAGLGLKLRLLQSGSEAELRFWRLPWRREEGEGPKVVCYVNSEHCYTTPAEAGPEEVQDKVSGSGPSPELNLLAHIESLQHEICKRLERMETELDGLESWLDELESPDPLSRLPELKQRIRRLLRDLSLVRQLSISV